MNGFHAANVAVEIAEKLKPVVEAVKRKDPELADQLYRACKSLALAVPEGGRRGGKDRAYHFRIGAGSTAEAVRTRRWRGHTAAARRWPDRCGDCFWPIGVWPLFPAQIGTAPQDFSFIHAGERLCGECLDYERAIKREAESGGPAAKRYADRRCPACGRFFGCECEEWEKDTADPSRVEAKRRRAESELSLALKKGREVPSFQRAGPAVVEGRIEIRTGLDVVESIRIGEPVDFKLRNGTFVRGVVESVEEGLLNVRESDGEAGLTPVPPRWVVAIQRG